MPKIYFVGVDVGTTSARAALVTASGQVVSQCTQPIKIWNPLPDHYEQSSDDIWNAICECVKHVVSGVPKEEIVAISFDATCSLVVLGVDGEPITVSTTGNPDQNVILWMDHRATKETKAINATNHRLLEYVGGQVSLEMEMPKLLWLKNNLFLSSWSNMWRAFDLPDYLTWRSTGCDSRSLCSVVCKWNYDAVNGCWSKEFLTQIGLEELCRNEFEVIGRVIVEPGSAVGKGLSEDAASNLNLLPGIVVGASLIDAHAGALGMFGCNTKPGDDVQKKLALICGTSTCHMSLTKEPCMAKGIWGPYKSAIIPGFHLNEGGQSAAGVLLDHVVNGHPQSGEIRKKLGKNEHIYSYLNGVLVTLAQEQKLDDVCFLTKDLHVWPDFHGNRSPIADPTLKGMISGLNMKSGEEELALLYLAVLQALAYGTRHIIDNLKNHNRLPFDVLLFCGGLAKNPLYVQSHADICHTQAVVPDEQEMVLVGAAILGACAAKVFPSLEQASRAMGGTGQVLQPNKATADFHNKKYKVFLKMLADQKSYREIMSGGD